MPSKQSGYGMESVRENKKKRHRIARVYSVPRDLVAISKMNVTLGSGGRVPWQSVEKWTREAVVVAKFYVQRERKKDAAKRTASEITTQINTS
jgi:hypothetical protein